MIFKKDISSLHVPHNKNTAGCEPVKIETPKEVILPMNMHSGGEAEPIVTPGDHVYVGQLIAREEGRFSSPVHATVSGTVAEILTLPTARGKEVKAIRIESDGKMEKDPAMKAPVFEGCDGFLQAVRESGVVGLGGAAFPTWAKLNEATNPDYKVDTVLINAAECEPYITSDHRMMLAHADLIDDGIEYMRKYMNEYLGEATYKICIEKNKPDAIEVLKKKFADKPYVVIHELNAIYPQGAKQVMLYNATGRVAIAGKRFPSFGALIINVSTLSKMAEYLNTGMPLVERIVTVDGPAVKKPGNFIAPIGTSMKDVFDFCGGFKEEPRKVMYGGPMMGIAVPTLDEPIIKNTNAILAFNDKDATLPDETPCIRCGNCINHCPLNLNPPAIAKALASGDGAEIAKTKVNICMECGACVFVCPAHRMIVHRNKLAKAELRAYQTKLAEQKKKEEENK